jgi:phosphatidylinositol transfer protein SFH5
MKCHRYIGPEHLPAGYGGLRRNNDQDFSPDDKVLEHRIRANSVSTVEFPVNEVLNNFF